MVTHKVTSKMKQHQPQMTEPYQNLAYNKVKQRCSILHPDWSEGNEQICITAAVAVTQL